MKSRRSSPLVFMLLGGASLAGCKQPTAPEPQTSAPSEPTEAPAPEETKDPDQGAVTIGPEIAEMCQLSSTRFDFDSSSLGRQAASILDALAACFTDGPGSDKTMLLVGHADPRGDEEYNLGLGQRRADAVAGYLRAQGLDSDRVETSSRGELDARGSDESSWANDRRVEVFLAD